MSTKSKSVDLKLDLQFHTSKMLVGLKKFYLNTSSGKVIGFKNQAVLFDEFSSIVSVKILKLYHSTLKVLNFELILRMVKQNTCSVEFI